MNYFYLILSHTMGIQNIFRNISKNHYKVSAFLLPKKILTDSVINKEIGSLQIYQQNTTAISYSSIKGKVPMDKSCDHISTRPHQVQGHCQSALLAVSHSLPVSLLGH